MELINYAFTQPIIWFTSRVSLSFLGDTLGLDYEQQKKEMITMLCGHFPPEPLCSS